MSCIDFRYITDALTPEEALDDSRAAGAHEGRARERAAGRRLSRLHDLGRLVRLLGRPDPLAVPRGAGGRLDAFQGQGRRRARRRCAAVGLVRNEIGRAAKLMIDANQRWDVGEAIERVKRAREVRPLVDRGADVSRRCARACGDRAGRRARSASRPASTARTVSSSSSCCRPRRSASARSTAAGSAA